MPPNASPNHHVTWRYCASVLSEADYSTRVMLIASLLIHSSWINRLTWLIPDHMALMAMDSLHNHHNSSSNNKAILLHQDILLIHHLHHRKVVILLQVILSKVAIHLQHLNKAGTKVDTLLLLLLINTAAIINLLLLSMAVLVSHRLNSNSNSNSINSLLHHPTMAIILHLLTLL